METGSKKVFVNIDLVGMDAFEKKFPETAGIALNWYSKHIQRLAARTNAIIYECLENRYSILFDSPDVAFSAIIDVAEGIISENLTDIGILPFRISAHIGEFTSANASYVGPGPGRSLALIRFASAGNVLLTKSFKTAIKKSLGSVKLREVGFIKLDDNFTEEMIYQILFFHSGKDASALTRNARAESNFVPQKMNFTARAAELDTLFKLLCIPEKRMVSITGEPGVGKTRLALQTASELRMDFPDGTFLADLTWVKDISLVPFVVAEALKGETSAFMSEPSPVERLKTLINTRKIILILDGIDHIAGFDPVLKEILRGCTGLKIITTSAENPHFKNVEVFNLEDMKFPFEGEMFHLKMAQSYPAIDFILHAAYSADVKIDFEDETLGGVVDLCRKLNGNPYAMELLIANDKNLEPQAFPKLINEAGGTLNSVIRYVYDRSLSAEEKSFLSVVSVFEPSFNTIDAEKVCEAAELLTGNVKKMCENLYEKRILFRMTVPDGAVRYYINSHIRAYILIANGNYIKAYTAIHDKYMLETAGRYVAEKDTINGNKMTGMITRRFNNFRVLLQTIVFDGDKEKISALLPMIGFYCRREFLVQEGLLWLERMAECLKEKKYRHQFLSVNVEIAWMYTYAEQAKKEKFMPLITATLEAAKKEGFEDVYINSLSQLGWHYNLNGNIDLCLKYFNEELEHADKVKDPLILSSMYYDMAWYFKTIKDKAQELKFLQRQREILKESGLIYSRDYIGSLFNLQEKFLQADMYAESKQVAEEIISIFAKSEDQAGVAKALRGLGNIERRKKNYAEAIKYYDESLRIFKELGNISGVGSIMLALSYNNYCLGNYSEALDEILEAMKISYEINDLLYVGVACYRAAKCYAKLGYYKKAVYLLGGVKNFFRIEHVFPSDVNDEELKVEDNINEIRPKIEQAEFAAAWMEGFSAKIEDMIREAQDRKFQ